jgi:hypothetical protein
MKMRVRRIPGYGLSEGKGGLSEIGVSRMSQKRLGGR